MSKVDRMKLGRAHDRRFKLTEEQIAEMRALYDVGVTKSELARRYGVTFACASYNVDDEAREKALASMKQHNLVRPPRDKAYRAAYMRELRAYKKKINAEVRDERNT